MNTVRAFLSFLLCLAASNATAADFCTNPSEYTIDRRCYVTNSQKKELPYRAVAGLVDADGIYCTGTIINENGKLYLYTAAHCVWDEHTDIIAGKITVRLQDGRNFTASKRQAGKYHELMPITHSEDWAVYDLNASVDSVPYTSVSNGLVLMSGMAFDPTDTLRDTSRAPLGGNKALAVGYGILTIMSDAEIQDFKDKYIYWLTTRAEKPVQPKHVGRAHGVYSDGAIHTNNTDFLKYIDAMDYDYYDKLFSDMALKVSYCYYSHTGSEIACQIWGGNSGGGLFDVDGKLMGIVTRGYSLVGGPRHGKASSNIKLTPYY